MSFLGRLPANILVVIIALYKVFISVLLPASCRFYPTCSAYAAESLKRFGLLRGLWLSVMRILRCNRFFEGGYDPVPEKFSYRFQYNKK